MDIELEIRSFLGEPSEIGGSSELIGNEINDVLDENLIEIRRFLGDSQ